MALDKNIVVLIGGVGGAKLALGLSQVAQPEQLTFIVNTGDDFWHLGLKICPDLDTLMYTLSGLVDPSTGWGVADDSDIVLRSLQANFGREPWFRLGDKDLATHLLRTQLLRSGATLTEATRCMTKSLGLGARLLPMSDSEVPTMVDTVEMGVIGFQEYFVRHRWQPTVRSIRHQNREEATVSLPVRAALADADIVLIAPSNPWLSLAPILAIPDLRALLSELTLPIVAVTPIIAGDAVKGPTAKIMTELGIEVSAKSVADYYCPLINGFVDDIRNPLIDDERLRLARLDTLMTDQKAKTRLAREILTWIQGWVA